MLQVNFYHTKTFVIHSLLLYMHSKIHIKFYLKHTTLTILSCLKSVAIAEPPSRITSDRSNAQNISASGGDSIPRNHPSGSKQNPM